MTLKTITICLVFLLCLAISTQAESKVEVSHGTVDFGYVYQGQTLTHAYWLKSIGTDTVRITNIWPGCGCTQIPIEDSVIAPGDSLPLQIIFSSGRFRGSVKKQPEITTNASDLKIKLFLYATVLTDSGNSGPLSVRPKRLDVSQFGEKTRRVAKFHIENHTDQNLKLEMVDSTLKSFEVKLPDKIGAGETVEGRIRVFEDRVETEFEESLTFRVKDLDHAVYTLPVRRLFKSGE